MVAFIDGQNLYNRCKAHFGHPWAHPVKLVEALVAEDCARHGHQSHCIAGIRYYTGIHDPNRRPAAHGAMDRRLEAYKKQGVLTFPIPVRYDAKGRAREKGVDTRIALDLSRLGTKGLFDVAIIFSEDSDLDPAVSDLYGLRDHERWIAVENALPWSPSLNPRWLPSARRRRLIKESLFDAIKDTTTY